MHEVLQSVGSLVDVYNGYGSGKDKKGTNESKGANERKRGGRRVEAVFADFATLSLAEQVFFYPSVLHVIINFHTHNLYFYV